MLEQPLGAVAPGVGTKGDESALNVRILGLLLLLGVASTSFAKEDARQLYDQALQLEKTFKSSGSLQKQVASWEKVIRAFRNVYYSFPSSGYCDNSLFHVASLYAEMGNIFHDALYFRRASGTYQFLIEQYPSSSLVSEAMLESIRIMRRELRNEQDALAMEKRLRNLSPATAKALTKRSEATAAQPATLKSIRHYTGTDYSRIVIDFDQEVGFKRDRLSDPDRLYVDFENTVATKDLLQQTFPVDDGFLKQIRVGQNNYRTARVVLDLKSIETFEIFALYHPYRLIIDVQGKKGTLPPVAEVEPVEPPEMAQANSGRKYSLARQLGLKVQRIIIDPGHGGHDPGAMQGNLREKDITLDVALRLKAILENEQGYEVLMTRDQDVFVPLEQRTAFANSNSADLFVSVHVNSSRNKQARGVETYYLNFATTPEAMEVAARENAIAEKNMAELQKLTTAIALNSKIEESHDFAKSIQTHLVSRLQKEYAAANLGVKQAPFYVLIGAQMPSILAEISFLSNQRESGLLATSRYRQSVAEGLARGVRLYTETLAENKLTQKRN